MSVTPATVLVIDDDKTHRALVAGLIGEKYNVLQAPDGAQGLESFLAERPDCVLLDHYLPGKSGLDVLPDLVRNGGVVLMMTASENDQLAAEAFKRGARDCLLKNGMNRNMLLRIVARELERRRLELDLQATRERFDEVAGRISEVLWMRNPDGDFIYLSPAFERVWGVPGTEMTAQRWDEMLHPDDVLAHAAAFDRGTRGQQYEVEFRIVRPDGEVRNVRSYGYPLFEGEELARIGGVARDVTEELRLHAELRLAQKLEAIGQLAAGIAHEINTPTQYVGDNVSFLKECFGSLVPLLEAVRDLNPGADEPADTPESLQTLAEGADLDYLICEVPAAIEQSLQGIRQIKNIVLAMKAFSHPGDEMTPTDMNQTIQDTVTVARNEWKYVAEVKLDLAPDLPEIVCRPSEINQVVMNLLVNAAHAIGDAKAGDSMGEISITTRREGDCVVFDVRDTGCGIPEDLREKIFDPFFTTKAQGKGTGQGLAISHRVIVDHHGGAISVASEIGRGSCFSVRLPIAPRGTEGTGMEASELAAG